MGEEKKIEERKNGSSGGQLSMSLLVSSTQQVKLHLECLDQGGVKILLKKKDQGVSCVLARGERKV